MCSCPVIPASLVETIFFSITYFCLICHRSVDWMCMGLFLGSLFCSVDLCVCFSALGCQIFHGRTFIWLNRGFTVLLPWFSGALEKNTLWSVQFVVCIFYLPLTANSLKSLSQVILIRDLYSANNNFIAVQSVPSLGLSRSMKERKAADQDFGLENDIS